MVKERHIHSILRDERGKFTVGGNIFIRGHIEKSPPPKITNALTTKNLLNITLQ